MANIFERGNKVSNFLKKEFWPEVFHCRKAVTVTLAGTTELSPGEVLQLVGGKYVVVDADMGAAGVDGGVGTDVLAVVVDSDWDLKRAAAVKASEADVLNVAVLFRGPCELRKGGLILADATDSADVYAILEKQGFTLADNFSFAKQSLAI